MNQPYPQDKISHGEHDFLNFTYFGNCLVHFCIISDGMPSCHMVHSMRRMEKNRIWTLKGSTSTARFFKAKYFCCVIQILELIVLFR